MSRKSAPARPAVEWVVGIFSALLLVALIAFLLDRALSADGRPPRLSVAIEGIERTQGGTVVWIVLANDGDGTAAAVRVQAARKDARGDDARREIEFDYVASQAVRRGAFLFADAQISASDLDVEVVSFVEP